MADLIELATGKLNDPILMDWAISRYWRMEKCHPQHREAMELAWFDDLSLRRWLNSGNENILTRLFVHLPAERFVNLGQLIGEHWGGWNGNLAYHSAPILAQYQPDLAWKPLKGSVTRTEAYGWPRPWASWDGNHSARH